MKNLILIPVISFWLIACGGTKEKPKTTPTDLPKDSIVLDDTLPRPMMIKVLPREFKGMMEKVPFAFDENFVRDNKIKQIKCVEDIVSEGKTIASYSTNSWLFNTDGKLTRWLWEEKGNGKVKKDTLIYKNGLLIQSGLTMYLRSPEPDMTQYTYKDGLLVKTSTQITEDMVENISYKYANGKLSEEKNDLRSRTTTYQYKSDVLSGYIQKDPNGTNQVKYEYDERGRLTAIRNTGEFIFDYTIAYSPNGQMKEMKWIEGGELFVDFFFDFDVSGKLISIKNKGYSAAWHDSETFTFTYEYY